MAVSPAPALAPQPARYTAFYCEENIYHLVASLRSSAGESSSSGTRVYAVFISNAQRKSLLFHQKAADPEQGYVIWDYHVVAVTVTPRAGSAGAGAEADNVVRVFDPDSNLDEFEGGPQDGHSDGAPNGFDFDGASCMRVCFRSDETYRSLRSRLRSCAQTTYKKRSGRTSTRPAASFAPSSSSTSRAWPYDTAMDSRLALFDTALSLVG